MLETISLALALSFGSMRGSSYGLHLRLDSVPVTPVHRAIAAQEIPLANQRVSESNLPSTESQVSPLPMPVIGMRVGSPTVTDLAVGEINDKELAGATDLDGLLISSDTSAGSQAPNFSLPALDGTEVSLEAMHGKIVLLNFWASWCGPCRIEMPSLEHLYRDFSAYRDFALLTVNTEQRDTPWVQNFMANNGYDFPVLLDAGSAASAAYGVRALPSTFVIGRDGRILWRHSGALDWSDPKLRDALKALLEKRPRHSPGPPVEASLSSKAGG
jgi:peroxiredoxin